MEYLFSQGPRGLVALFYSITEEEAFDESNKEQLSCVLKYEKQKLYEELSCKSGNTFAASAAVTEQLDGNKRRSDGAARREQTPQ